MDRERFEHILAAYGADPGHWPAQERAAAAAFATAHATDVAASLAQARALDGLLMQDRDMPAIDPALASRLVDMADRVHAARFDRRGGLALAACALLGLAIGYGGGNLAPIAQDGDEATVAAYEVLAADYDWLGECDLGAIPE